VAPSLRHAPLIGAGRQQEFARIAPLAFFGSYLEKRREAFALDDMLENRKW